MAIKILIADDHELIRIAFKILLELEDDFKVLDYEVNTGKDALEAIVKLTPDIVLLDINMPIMTGLEVLKTLRKQNSKQKIIMLSVHDTIDYIQQAFKLGCNGYITKNVDAQTLTLAIKSVYAGKEYTQPELLSKLMREQANKSFLEPEPQEELTDRELEILSLLVKGSSTVQISDALNITEKTVRNHLYRMYKKINVVDRVQAVRYGIDHGLK